MRRLICIPLWLSAVLGLAGCTYVYYPPPLQPAEAGQGGLGGATVTPTNCREFSQTVTIENKPAQATGYACRQQDGSWRIM